MDPGEAQYNKISTIHHLAHIAIVNDSSIPTCQKPTGQSANCYLSKDSRMNTDVDQKVKSKVLSTGPHKQIWGTPYEGWVHFIAGMCIIRNLLSAL